MLQRGFVADRFATVLLALQQPFAKAMRLSPARAGERRYLDFVVAVLGDGIPVFDGFDAGFIIVVLIQERDEDGVMDGVEIRR